MLVDTLIWLASLHNFLFHLHLGYLCPQKKLKIRGFGLLFIYAGFIKISVEIFTLM